MLFPFVIINMHTSKQTIGKELIKGGEEHDGWYAEELLSVIH